jgi:translation elongation factor EF-G
MPEENTDTKRREGLLCELLSAESHFNTSLYSMLQRAKELGLNSEKQDKVYNDFDKVFTGFDQIMRDMFGVALPWGDPSSDIIPLLASSEHPRQFVSKEEAESYDQVSLVLVSSKPEVSTWYVPKTQSIPAVLAWFTQAKKTGLLAGPVTAGHKVRKDERTYTVVKTVGKDEFVLGTV